MHTPPKADHGKSVEIHGSFHAIDANNEQIISDMFPCQTLHFWAKVLSFSLVCRVASIPDISSGGSPRLDRGILPRPEHHFQNSDGTNEHRCMSETKFATVKKRNTLVCYMIVVTLWVNQHSYGKSVSLRGKSTIKGPCSIAMLNYQRVLRYQGVQGFASLPAELQQVGHDVAFSLHRLSSNRLCHIVTWSFP